MQGILSRERRISVVASVGIVAALLIFSLITTRELGDLSITLLSGLLRGMLLFLVAAGLSIVFGLMDVLNLAQGSFFMIGAYVGYEVHHSPDIIAFLPDGNLRFLLAVIVAVAIGAFLGVILERGLLRPLYSRPIFQIVTTFGVSIVLLEVVKARWGLAPLNWSSVFSFNEGRFFLFGQQFSTYRLFVIVVGMLLIVGVTLFLQRTRIGVIIRAGVEDSQMVEALGINVRLIFTGVFALGCAVAAFGGVIAGPFLNPSIALGSEFLLGAIAAVVLGGLGSFEGTAVASIMVGLAQAVIAKFGTDYLNQPYWETLTPMILLAVVLLLRPSGLFGKE